MARVLTVSIATASIFLFSAAVVAQGDEYKALDPNEVSCSISDFNYQGIVAAGGAIAPTAGHIGSFQCRLPGQDSRKAIPLAKDEFVDGGIVTSDFGVFKVLFGASLTGGSSVSFMATDAQMGKLKALLVAKRADGVKQPLMAMQAKLKELGFDPGPVDGAWGARTESAVRQFQRDQGLVDTGQLDSNTREALLKRSPLGSPPLDELLPEPRIEFILDRSVEGNWAAQDLAELRQIVAEAVRLASIGIPVETKSVYVYYDNGFGVQFDSRGRPSNWFSHELKIEVKEDSGELTFQKTYKGPVANAHAGGTFTTGGVSGISRGPVNYKLVLEDVERWLQEDPPPPPVKKAPPLVPLQEDPPPPPVKKAPPLVPKRIRVGGAVQKERILTQVRPQYPPLARQARVQGTVKLSAVIDTDGTVLDLKVISGHPLLIPAAMAAVKQWRYKPTTVLNGIAVEVITLIDVNFTLSG